ncbi:MAG TPA: six-hairpin glycosidase, partial [Planctomycetaceae bacterium]|nr:six-hairpin glycosidase [Planctomycetaceae bacterium]
PKDSSDRSIPRTSFWNHRGTREWVQYDFEEPRTISSVSVYWFDDGRQGWDCRVPKSWRVLSRDGEAWKPVETRDAYATARDQYNHVTFTPVRTKALRLEIQLAEPWSGGILEWQVR